MNETKLQRITKVVEEYVREHGEITTEQLLDMARPEDSPIHDCFEWNDDDAGHQFRLIQSRTYLRKVRIEYAAKPEQLVHVPSVVVADGAYKPVSVVVQSATDFERAFSEAIRRLRAAQHAVEELRSAATGADDDRMAVLAIALSSISTAQTALERIQH